MQQAQAQLGKAQMDMKSSEKLHESNVVSDFDVQQTRHDLNVARANLTAARAALDAARNNLSFTELRSPSDGVIGRIPYRKGDYVGPTTQEGLTVVSGNCEMYVYFSLSESRIMEYLTAYGSMQRAIDRMPQPVLLLNGGKTYAHKGRVESISGVVDDQTGAVSVRAVFPNPDGLLLSGSTARIVMSQQQTGAIVIPQEATYEILNKTYVYRVVNGTATSTMITTESVNNGHQYVVTSGLKPGDVIIAKGAGLVQGGQK